MSNKFILLSLLLVNLVNCRPDLTVVGEFDYWGSLTRTTIGAIDILADKLSINTIRTPRKNAPINFKDMPERAKKVIKNSNKKEYGSLVVLFETLHIRAAAQEAKKFPKNSIRAAISVIEFSQIPKYWVDILNNNLDMVIVPDPYLINVYKKSGVKTPIFFLPNGIYTKPFLKKEAKPYNPSKPFTFGTSATFIPRKNNELLVDSFIKAYGNNPKFRLIICGRYGDEDRMQAIKNKLKKYNIKNVFIDKRKLSENDFIDFMSSIDVYVSFSKGEGFSMTPREAMLLNKPCILSNNTAHINICKTGLVKAVPSNIKEKAIGGDGYYYNCKLEDAVNALKDVYNNYEKYLAKTDAAKEWALQYDYFNQTALYMGFIKPDKIILGSENKIYPNYIVTNSRALYDKYKRVLKV